MEFSSRIQKITESATLKLNAKASELVDGGEKIYNLTAGQFPFKPMPEFVDQIRGELNFLKSYQYSPVLGIPELRKKLLSYFKESRNLDLSNLSDPYDCIVSNGGKHSLYNIFGALLDPGDEVILFAPYWLSYPEIIKLHGGKVVLVRSNIYDHFEPSLDDIAGLINENTKAIVVNSPNNPTGISYSDEWMKGFADLMANYKDVFLISDEIYFGLYYYDPKPSYFYQYDSELLERTFIVDGISKALACTGLRLGYCFGPKPYIEALSKFQGQTTSCASSLIQRSLLDFDFSLMETFLKPIKSHLRTNAEIVRYSFREANLSHAWYQSTSAFYYLIDFSQMPIINVFKQEKDDQSDYAEKICDLILEKFGVALVPGTDFGAPNTGRVSLVAERDPFEEAILKLIQFLISD